MKRGDIYLASFPYGDAPGMKLRPTLMLAGPFNIGSAQEIIVAYISSVAPPSNVLPSDIMIDPTSDKFKSTKLKQYSVLRLHKVATIHVSSLKRKLGNVSSDVQTEVDDILKTVLSL